jgi:anti-anti-sigma regulatory factor
MEIPVHSDGETATVYAGDYLNKLTGEKIERECRRYIEAGATRVIVDFSETEIVNSVGISILLGVIDIATNSGAQVTFAGVNDTNGELFDTLGLTQHVKIA